MLVCHPRKHATHTTQTSMLPTRACPHATHASMPSTQAHHLCHSRKHATHAIHVIMYSTPFLKLLQKTCFCHHFQSILCIQSFWDKIIHNGLTISPSLYSINYLKPSLLCLNLSDTTIWFTFTESMSTGCLDLWNSFLLTLRLSNFNVFSLILILSQNKTYLFSNASLLCWISCWYLFLWYSLILSFSFFDRFFYWSLEFFFTTSLLSK